MRPLNAEPIKEQVFLDDYHRKEMVNYGFEIAPTPIRFGRDFTSDIGHEVDKLHIKNPVIITDENVVKTRAMQEVTQSLLPKAHISYDIFDKATTEPTDKSLKYAIEFARNKKYDCFIAVGGDSVMDTARIVALFASNPQMDLDDLLKHPHGRYVNSENPVYPLISIPTTFSLASESDGGLTFKIADKNTMCTICNEAVKPSLIIADPLNVLSVPKNIAAYGALDLFIHALEAFTLKAYMPHISNMPFVTGADLQSIFRITNSISDIWATETLEIMHKYLRRAVQEPEDVEARSQLLMAATFSGMGFRNPAIRLCHTLSYPIRALGKYEKDNPKVPHGLAVAVMAPVAFMFSAYADPTRHLEASRILGQDLAYNSSPQKIGHGLADILRNYLRLFKIPNGLSELGFKFEDLAKLAELGVENFRTSPSSSKEMDQEILREMYEFAWKIY
uniref:Alcohol dehydrogenase iron-type/glycerol dehydrogenase GldA domain-containing protein n=1 Tax=Acrobeloides nanus TaxID=290746 RepID=A0A914C875_9BILA